MWAGEGEEGVAKCRERPRYPPPSFIEYPEPREGRLSYEISLRYYEYVKVLSFNT